MLDRLVLRRFAEVAAVSEEVERQLLRAGVRPEKVRLIRNGVELDRLSRATPALAESRPLVGLVGRLAREKGVDLFLQAAAAVLREVPEARFAVIGEGPDRAMLETLLAELELGGKATLGGRRDDMADVYASLTVLVSASRQEGMPVTILEAMGAGLAIVAIDVGEVPALIVDSETGLLVKSGAGPEQTVRELAAATVRLLREPALRETLGRAARQRVEERFSARQMTVEYLAMYRNAMEGGKV